MRFYVMNVSLILCKLRLFSYVWMETFYSWMMVKLLMGAIIALWFPLHFHTLKEKKLFQLSPLILFILTFLSAAPVFYVADLVKVRTAILCTVSLGSIVIIDKIYVFLSTMNNVLYPQIFQVILTIMLGYRIFKLAHQRRNLFAGKKFVHRDQETSMKRGAVIVFVILIAVLFSVLPSSITWTISFVLEMLPNPSMELAAVMKLLTQVLLASAVLPHTWNLLIYLWKIPNFYKEIWARLHF